MHKNHLQNLRFNAISAGFFPGKPPFVPFFRFGLPWPRHQRVDLVGLPSAPSQANLDGVAPGGGW